MRRVKPRKSEWSGDAHQDIDVSEVLDDLLDEAVDVLPLGQVCGVGLRYLFAVLLLLLLHQGDGLLVGLGGDVDARQPARRPK